MFSSWKPKLLVATVAAVVIVAAAPAIAETDTATLTVRVTVQEACSIAGTTIDFGTYSAGQQAALDAEGDISYNGCAAGTLTIALDGGTAGNIDNRQMTNGEADLAYQLFTNSTRSQIWGSDNNALQKVLLVPDSGTIPVYARIAGGQNVAGGTYTDTVNVTLSF